MVLTMPLPGDIRVHITMNREPTAAAIDRLIQYLMMLREDLAAEETEHQP